MTRHAMTEKTEPQLGSESIDHEINHAAAKAATLAAIEAARGEMRRHAANDKQPRADNGPEPSSPSPLETAAAPASTGAEGALELRVLQGPQVGARTAWDRTQMVIATDGELPASVSGEDEPIDILLFDDPDAPVRIRLTGVDDHIIMQVLHGQIRLQDQVFKAGDERAWSMYQRVTIGQSIIAYGLSSVAHWPTRNEDDTTSQPDVDRTDEQAAQPADTPAQNNHRAITWLTIMLGGIAMICAAAFWQLSPGTVNASPTAGANPVDLAAQMRASPFAQLTAVRMPDGDFLVRGRLATSAERRALDAWLVEYDVTARVEVVVDDLLARDVAEVFRVNGVNVRTQVAAPGQILTVADEPDRARLADATKAVRRDVPGLARLDVKNTAKPAPPRAPKVPADPNKRIV